MKITSLNISSDRTKITAVITDASTATSLKLWTDLTYKDYSKAINLTSKLTGSSTETIDILLSDIGISYFDGVYFVEVESPTDTSNAVTGDLTRYKECILNKIISVIQNNECLMESNPSVLTAQTLLYALEAAIENSFPSEILNILGALNKYCSAQCKTCGEYKNIASQTYYNS